MNAHDDKSGKEQQSSGESGFLGSETGEHSNSSFQDNRPEALVQRQMQVAANNSPQVEQAMQLQQVANNFTGTMQREGSESESESESESILDVAEVESDSFASPPDDSGPEISSGPDPDLGADAENLSWFRDTYLASKGKLQQAEEDGATFNLVLKAIHREYGEWFGNSNRGTEAEVAEKKVQFQALENSLIGGEEPYGKFWCVVDGLESGRADMDIQLAHARAQFSGVTGYFESALDMMSSSPGVSSMEYAQGLWKHATRLSGEILEKRSQTLLLLHRAETLLGEGRAKFGGTIAKKPIVIDPDGIAEARAEQGTGDAPLSLHQNDGPGMAMKALKSAMVEYVLATRAKEDLRSELKVDKLKKVSKKAKKADPTIEPRIEEVRKRKEAAAARYQSVRKAVDALLKGGLSDEIQAEIAEIDHTYLGVSKAEAQDHLDTATADRSDKAETADKLGKVGDQLVISEAKYARLRRSIEPIAAAGVGSKTFGIDIGVSFAFGIGKGSEIKVGGGIKYSGKTDIQDDRKLRVSHSFGVYGSGSADLAGVVGASAGAELMKGKTEVFMDADHWASVMAYRFSSITKEINSLDDTQKVIEDELEPDQANAVLATSRMAEDGVTKVDSTALSGSLGASALGMGVSGSYEKKWLTFSKEGQTEKKQAKQTTKSVSISPGSNITVSVTRTIIDGHANPDNDGKYWNIKLELGGSASASFTAYTEASADPVYGGWEQGLRKAMGMDPSPSGGGGDGGFGFAEESLVSDSAAAESDGHYGGIVKAISDYLGAEVATIESKMKASIDLSVGLSASAAFSVEWNYVFSDASAGNELQYRRTSGGKSAGGSVSAPVGSVGLASVGLDLGVSKGSSAMLSEKLGDTTLTYLQTVFNGLHVRDVRNSRLGRDITSEWSTYVDGHDEEVWVALCKIGAEQGGAYAELVSAIESTTTDSGAPAADGVDPAAWGNIQRMSAETTAAATAFKNATAEQVGMDDIGTLNPGKFAILKASMTAYFDKQGALDKARTAMDWS